MEGLGAMAMVFVTHNLAVVSEIADRVVVMYAGETVEEGPVARVFAEPRHPYTAALIATGRVPPPENYPEAEDELEKRLGEDKKAR